MKIKITDERIKEAISDLFVFSFRINKNIKADGDADIIQLAELKKICEEYLEIPLIRGIIKND